ncbi:hypothetical protein IFM89_008599 [Coptis chinensis]|uniref:Uncharacterized protein n=1 Tax=Coptis chinensis TaxID=261450 RepID=A0A835HL67_9MAGN|nr:hypothetical protein IFM89_008599 [Coptis chinensis]
MESGLVELCISSASESKESIEKWRRQRRTLEKLPTPLAEALLRRLLTRRLVSPSLLEVFQHCIEEINLKGENLVDAEWMAYLGAFRYLQTLILADCRSITSSALWPLTGMNNLKELDLSRCMKVTDAGVLHLISIRNLEKLSVSETSLTADGVAQLSSLKKLYSLDLGGLPVTDSALSSLQVLRKLEYLDMWGSKISNNGAALLKMFLMLKFLNLAWTKVSKVPYLPSLTSLNISNCSVESIFEQGYYGVKAPHLAMLHLSGIEVTDVHEIFSYIDPRRLSYLDLSNSFLHNFQFLVNMTALEHLDVSFSRVEDDSVELIAHVGTTLKFLNLGNTRVSSAGIECLAGCIPNVETLILSHTAVDDTALPYIGMMPSLKVIDLSSSNIKGVLFLVFQISVTSVMEVCSPSYAVNLSKATNRRAKVLPGHLTAWPQGIGVVSCVSCPNTGTTPNETDNGFCHLVGNELDQILSLTALQNLNSLERLDLEETQVTDGALQPLSSMKDLMFLSLKSDFLTDASLLFLSSLLNLKFLGIRGAVLTNAGLLSFNPPPLLEILDLRDCWLLTEDALLSYCESYSQIEVRHEHIHNCTAAQIVFHDSSAIRGTSRPVILRPKLAKSSPAKTCTPCIPFRKEVFVDERLKYSRKELLELKSSPLPRVSYLFHNALELLKIQ